MDITLDKKNATESILNITLESSDYEKTVEDKLKDYAKKADIKGFRKGKVPLSYIKQRFEKSLLFDEIMNIASKGLNEYIAEHKLPILTDPILDQEKIKTINWEQPTSPLELAFKLFTFEVESYELSSKIKVKEKKIKSVDSSLIDRRVELLRNKFGEKKEVTESQTGDILYGTFTHPSQKEPLAFSVATGSLPDPSLEKLFIGKAPKEVISITPKDWFSIALKNSEQQNSVFAKKILQEDLPFIYTINRIVRPKLATLDQTLFDKAFGKEVVHNESEMRDHLKEEIIKDKENQAQIWLNKDIIDAVLEHVVIHFPDEHMKVVVRNVLAKNKEVTPEMLSNEGLLDSYYKSYKADMQWDLLSREIATKNQITVTEEEIIDYVASHLKQEMKGQLAGDGESDQRIKETAKMMLQARNGEHYNQLYSRMLIERVINFIKEKITIESEEITAKEFEEGFEKRMHSNT